MKPIQGTRRLSVAALALLLSAAVHGATLPAGFTETTFSGFSSPTAMALAPDGRIFVCQQGGSLRVIKNDVLLATPVLTVTVNSSGERGLLGVTLDPNFSQNNFLYVYYTSPTPAIHNRLSRFTLNGDVAVPGSETVLLNLDNLSSATNHNGGSIHFGPDGKLYVAVGDNANGNNAQSLTILFGKVLRLNSDGSIPTDNPFYTQTTGKYRSIWALGLRNPFTFAVWSGAPSMLINDVGEQDWEEINVGAAGANYGWPVCESPCAPPDPEFTDPLYFYGHTGGACAITGGDFYDPQIPGFPSAYVGQYFFADYCAGWIHRIDPVTATKTDFATGIASPVDIQVGFDGRLYYLAYSSGSVVRVTYTGSNAPAITQDPLSQLISVGHPVTFSVTATGAPPLSYQWQKNSADIPGATAPSYTIASAALGDSGSQYRCRVSNSSGTATSAQATLTVTVDQPPTASIAQPPAGATYAGGDTISFSGTGSDPEDGSLPASALTWWINFHHDTHFHPFLPPTTGIAGGSFVVPTLGETSPNVWYRIHLRVVDSAGLAHETERDMLPKTTTMTFATSPSGLQLTLDAQPFTAPIDVVGVEGITRTIGAPSPQGGNVFQSWSDGGAQTHNISTPASNTTYTATFTGGASPTPTRTRTFTPSPPPTSTRTPTVPPTATRTRTRTFTPSAPPTFTRTPTVPPTFTRTPTVPPTFTRTPTVPPTFTRTPTVPPTFTRTPTVPPTFTQTPTVPPTFTQTPTAVPATGTPTATPTQRPQPTVSTITPTSGAAAGGTNVAISGTNFLPTSTVSFGGQPASSSYVNPTQLNAIAPSLPPGTLNTVTVADDQSSGSLVNGWLADFSDVPSSNPHHGDVEKVFRNGITAGCGGGNYCASLPVKRSEMAVFLLKSKHGASYVPPAATGIFDDVPPGAFARDWIEELYVEGITGGCGPTTYCPEAPATRAQMAVFLLKSKHGSGYQPPPASGIFDDVPPGSFARDWIEELYVEGITAGCTATSYCPDDSTPRDQMATFLVRTFTLLAGSPGRPAAGLTGRVPLRILTRPPTRGPSRLAAVRATLRVRS